VRFADYSEVGIAKQRSPTMKIPVQGMGGRSNVPSASNVQNAEFLKVSVSALEIWHQSNGVTAEMMRVYQDRSGIW
jgi:hypothetical protein